MAQANSAALRLRPFTAVAAARRLFRNPEDTRQVFVAMNALRGRSRLRNFARFVATSLAPWFSPSEATSLNGLVAARQLHALMDGLTLQWLRAAQRFDIVTAWDQAVADLRWSGQNTQGDVA